MKQSVVDKSPPSARGALSEWMINRLHEGREEPLPIVPARSGLGDDLQLALYLSYELHYGDLPFVVDDHEWDPQIIAVRATLEREFERALSQLVGPTGTSGSIRTTIPAIIDADDGPSLSRYMEAAGTLEQMRDFVVHRSAYQLKEGDPHTFAIPRLNGRAKQILAEIQAGEYGADAPGRMMHSQLFAQTMRGLGLDDRRHAYLDVLPASALIISNLISLFGLNRRWRGALVGHLTVFEMTSVAPMGRYARGLERLGAADDVRRFYDVHVLADAEHERMALEMAQALADDEPHLAADIVFGARCALAAERLFAEELLGRWNSKPTRVRAAA